MDCLRLTPIQCGEFAHILGTGASETTVSEYDGKLVNDIYKLAETIRNMPGCTVRIVPHK